MYPLHAIFNATLVHNDKRDELLTFGFVNACFRSSEFKTIRKLPHYLKKLIGQSISIEYVHLIFHEGTGADDAFPVINHWKINVDNIIGTN